MASEKGTGWHRHEAEVHIVIMTKGWARFMYGDQETLASAGDCVHQRSGIVHYLFHYSPDMEYLEIVAPMSGHFATLLRDTVRTVLADRDVYITDWHNARDVALGAGRFGLDECIEHLMQWLAELGPGATSWPSASPAWRRWQSQICPRVRDVIHVSQ